MDFQYAQHRDIVYVVIFGAISERDADEFMQLLEGLLCLEFSEVVFNLYCVPSIARSSAKMLTQFHHKVKNMDRRVRIQRINDQLLQSFQADELSKFGSVKSLV